jgi:hypothetical protein
MPTESPVPTIPLAVGSHGSDITVDDLTGGILDIPRLRFHCLIEVPGFLLPREALIDTGAPLTIFPEKIWSKFQFGTDYDILPLVGAPAAPARVLGWQFTYQIARFRVPLALLDAALTIRVPRPDVIAQFATGNPTGWRSIPPIFIGLWGGLLEGGRLGIDRVSSTNRLAGELVYP